MYRWVHCRQNKMSGNPTVHSCLEKVTRIWGPPELWKFHNYLIEPWKCVWTFVKTDSCEGTNSIRRTFSSSIILKKIFSEGFVGETQIDGEHIFQEILNCKENFYFSAKYIAFVVLKRNAITKMWCGKFCKNTAWDLMQSFQRLETHKAPLMQILSWIRSSQEE